MQGLLRRDPDENLLSVTSITPTGAACGNYMGVAMYVPTEGRLR